MKPLVSIITPSYNQGRFISDTIESVLAQDYDYIEYIVIDGGSTDNTLDVLEKYKNRLCYISEKDNGQSDAINKGFRMAKGEIVAWLNSDDVYEPGCISRIVSEFQKDSELGLLYGDGYIIDENNHKLKVFEYTQKFDLWKLVNFWDYIMQPTAFFRLSYLKKVNYLDVNLHYCMDWDLWIRLASVSKVKYINKLLACSREYEETKTSTGGDKRLKEIISLLQKYSGKEKPLGVESYKASTFYTKYKNSIWPIKKFAGAYLNYKHRRLNKRIPVIYEDGWIGKEGSLDVPGYVKNVSVIVEMILPKACPQKINVFVNGKKEAEISAFKCGQHNLMLSLPEGKIINEISFVCDKVIRIGKGDNRCLSVRLADIQFDKSIKRENENA